VTGDRVAQSRSPGEHWPDGSLRPAIEDLIGAGAIIAALAQPTNPEAELALAAFQFAKPNLSRILNGCASGLELHDRGYPQDIALAADLDCSLVAPSLHNGGFMAA
jgi:2-phosphosulfolactate phosphatase